MQAASRKERDPTGPAGPGEDGRVNRGKTWDHVRDDQGQSGTKNPATGQSERGGKGPVHRRKPAKRLGPSTTSSRAEPCARHEGTMQAASHKGCENRTPHRTRGARGGWPGHPWKNPGAGRGRPWENGYQEPGNPAVGTRRQRLGTGERTQGAAANATRTRTGCELEEWTQGAENTQRKVRGTTLRKPCAENQGAGRRRTHRAFHRLRRPLRHPRGRTGALLIFLTNANPCVENARSERGKEEGDEKRAEDPGIGPSKRPIPGGPTRRI